MGAVLCQPEDTPAAKAAEQEEINGRKCQFDITLSGLRLRPIAFLDRVNSPAEKSYHSYVGEAATGRWAMGKFKKYLLGAEFTWIADCYGPKKFFEEAPTDSSHMIQQWRAELLSYQFVGVHRPARMLWEYNLLSRYNTATEEWRKQPIQEKHTATAAMVVPQPPALKTLLNPVLHNIPAPFACKGTKLNRPRLFERAILAIGCILSPLEEAIADTGSTIIHMESENNQFCDIPPWNAQNLASWHSHFMIAPRNELPAIEWLIAVHHKPKEPIGRYNYHLEQWAWEVIGLAQVLQQKLNTLKCIVLLAPRNVPSSLEAVQRKMRTVQSSSVWTDWCPRLSVLENTKFGGSIVTEYDMLCLLPNQVMQKLSLEPYDCTPSRMKEYLSPQNWQIIFINMNI